MVDAPPPSEPNNPSTPESAAQSAVRDEHTGDYLRLSQLWSKRTHHSLLLAAVDDSFYRDLLIQRLNAEADALRIDLPASARPDDWLASLVQASSTQAARVHICLPISPQRGADWWRQANVLRERLADAFPGPQLLWLADGEVDTVAHEAPDLWNWREAVLWFAAKGQTKPLSLPGPVFQQDSAIDSAALRQRLDAIAALLATSRADDGAAAHLLLEAASSHERLGEWDQADRLAQQAATDFGLLGNAAGQAQAMALRSDLLRRRGGLEAALTILQKDVLPVHERLGDVRSKAITMGKIADILHARGQLDEALRIRTDVELPVYESLADVRSKAIVLGKIADLSRMRGLNDQALRIHIDQEIPVYELIGDARSRAITLGQIADILHDRGQLDEALRIRTEEQLPVFERLGDVRSKAVTMGKIADILFDRGQFEEALRIRTEEELPIYEHLSDLRSKAVTLGGIADIMHARGQLNEALHIRTEEELPVYERLGNARELLVCRANTAMCLLARSQAGDRDRARTLLTQAYAAAKQLGLPERAHIKSMFSKAFGSDLAD